MRCRPDVFEPRPCRHQTLPSHGRRWWEVIRVKGVLAGVEGLEPPAPGFGDRCSSRLSYTPKQSLPGLT